MKIIIFGAAGRTGRLLTQAALHHGHTVTATARSFPSTISNHSRLSLINCDVLNASAVRLALDGHDVVFCTLGGPRNGVTIYSQGTLNIVKGMQQMNVPRLVFLSNFGVLGEAGNGLMNRALLWLARPSLKDTLIDHRHALDTIRSSGLEWVAVRPMTLTNGPAKGDYRVDLTDLPRNGTHISRADVAEFMLVAGTSDKYLNQAPAIAY